MQVTHEWFVAASYGVTAVLLLAVCLDSYVRWRRVKQDYLRLFARKDKNGNDADA